METFDENYEFHAILFHITDVERADLKASPEFPISRIGLNSTLEFNQTIFFYHGNFNNFQTVTANKNQFIFNIQLKVDTGDE